MASIVNRDAAPAHLFNISELDFSDDLFAERAGGLWFRLGAWTIEPQYDERGVEDVVRRDSILLKQQEFEHIYDSLGPICNMLINLGEPSNRISNSGGKKEREYTPFYKFDFRDAPVVGEPLVFVVCIDSSTSPPHLCINPDLWLFLKLEQESPGSGTWRDPQRGVDVIIQQRIDASKNVEIVDIRTDYLRKYLQARQMSLVVGHFHQLKYRNPSANDMQSFVKGKEVLEGLERKAKAILYSQNGFPDNNPFLMRELNLWFEVMPPDIDVEVPWAETPPFDIYKFTLPTRHGPMAPGHKSVVPKNYPRTFEGVNFIPHVSVFFRQEVLSKYQGASGFKVGDDGRVSYHHYWGLFCHTDRIGNELLSVDISGFAEGLPYEEWPHWKQYAVTPPSSATETALRQEQSVPDAVNSLGKALEALNSAFAGLSESFVTIYEVRMNVSGALWDATIESLAGRQLKWVYPANADDDEFIKRVTLISTLVIDALQPRPIRSFLKTLGKNLHKNGECKSLGSRKLLQRLTLIAALINNVQPDIKLEFGKLSGGTEIIVPLHRRIQWEFVSESSDD
ncbi:MAG TPA: hypothetical protein ENN09_06395, partial [Planctomycetes bacterium]|nr:hypothetical protein [Planctomycetota bacterium]